MTEGPLVIGVACEDKRHFTIVTTLIQAEALAHHAWLDGVFDTVCRWRGLDGTSLWSKPDRDSPRLVINGRRVPQGPIDGRPLEHGAGMWRALLTGFMQVEPRPDIVVVAQDIDADPRRRNGLEQVRKSVQIEWPFPIVAAMPEPEGEAWLVSGFEPRNDIERRIFDGLRSALSFDPTTQSHRLTSRPNDAKTDAKKVLEQLCGGNEERELACLEDRARLRQRGDKNGLLAFLDEVAQEVTPRFGRRSVG